MRLLREKKSSPWRGWKSLEARRLETNKGEWSCLCVAISTPEYIYLINPVRSRASLVNKRFVTRLKMFGKNATITDWNNIATFKLAILIGSRLGVYSRLMLNKKQGKELEEKKGIIYVKASFFKNVSHKTTRKSSRVIVRDHSGQCPVQYLENIGPAMEQSN